MFKSAAKGAHRRVIERAATLAVVGILAVTAVAQEDAPAAAPILDGQGAQPLADAVDETPPVDEATLAALAFQQFCNDWLEKLVRREEQNVANIQWVTTEIGVRGTYTGYSRRGQCETKRGTDSVPVGKLTYKQIEYEKKGPTLDLAEISPARPLSVAEVVEIFHYAGGRWVY